MRTYIIEKRLQSGQLRRITIGDVKIFSPEQARKIAQVKLGEMASGVDPAKEKRTHI